MSLTLEMRTQQKPLCVMTRRKGRRWVEPQCSDCCWYCSEFDVCVQVWLKNEGEGEIINKGHKCKKDGSSSWCRGAMNSYKKLIKPIHKNPDPDGRITSFIETL